MLWYAVQTRCKRLQSLPHIRVIKRSKSLLGGVAVLSTVPANSYNIRSHLNNPMSTENKNTEAGAELQRLNKALEIAKRNGNQLFIENIEREIAAIKQGNNSPLIVDYLTNEERSGRRPGREA